MEITKDMLLLEALRSGNTAAMAKVLNDYGMHCLGCALARHETVEQAALSNGVDVDEMVEALNIAAKSE